MGLTCLSVVCVRAAWASSGETEDCDGEGAGSDRQRGEVGMQDMCGVRWGALGVHCKSALLSHMLLPSVPRASM